jgi:putative proteasome-type protease
VLVSFDSTMRSNLSVGMPIDLALLRARHAAVGNSHRFDEHDPYFLRLRQSWGEGVRRAFAELPNPDW